MSMRHLESTGFFNSSKFEIQSRKKIGCHACGLHKTCLSPKMSHSGQGKRSILVIAEAPGKEEDKSGTQLVGKAGEFLRKELERVDIDLDEDCWKTNAVNCRPMTKTGSNRTPTSKEVDFCRPKMFEVVRGLRPKAIFLLGGIATESFLKEKLLGSVGGITKWRGLCIPDREVGAWVMPMFHPSYVIRENNLPVVLTIFRQDLKRAASQVDKPLPQYREETELIDILEDEEAILDELKRVLSLDRPVLMAFDYETTGMKPHREGHDIVCCGICTDESRAAAFMMDSPKVRIEFSKVLTDKSIRKTAHNMKFEHVWSQVVLGTTVKGWKWDTMIAAHILDNRTGVTGLKFQSYVNFGVTDYESSVAKYLSGEGSGNSFNSIRKAPLQDLLLYCGLDSLLQRRLALKQMRKVRRAKG